MLDFPPPPPPPGPKPPPLGHSLEQAALPDRATVRRLLEAMLRSRLIEQRIVELYRQNKISGGCYTGIGNEATSVGSAFALADNDVLVPTHRDMGSHLVRGHTPLEVMRQYLKKATSQTGGKDTGLHLGLEGSNIVGMISHLAHMMPVAVGVALAERQKGTPAAVLTTVGEGASSLGDFHESLNFAAIQKLPVIFVIVNNQYAYSTPATIQYAAAKLSDRAIGYGMYGAQLDGTDVYQVLSATKEARARGLRGEGPSLLECVTMRMRGHSEHDDMKYVPKELVEAWRAWDPVARLEARALDDGFLTADELPPMKAAIQREIDEAIDQADREPDPEPESAVLDVFREWRPEWSVPDGVDRLALLDEAAPRPSASAPASEAPELQPANRGGWS
jgi:TPP-dependent pyruvate/acetoin dehydrogenase alpha subunit